MPKCKNMMKEFFYFFHSLVSEVALLTIRNVTCCLSIITFSHHLCLHLHRAELGSRREL